jgi:hypothetical protein
MRVKLGGQPASSFKRIMYVLTRKKWHAVLATLILRVGSSKILSARCEPASLLFTVILA